MSFPGVRHEAFSSLLLWLTLVSACYAGQPVQTKYLSCEQLQADAKSLQATIAHQPPLVQRRALLRSLHDHPDDPENCATGSLENRVLELERSMIRLEVGNNPPASPEWLLQCDVIQSKSQHCDGLLADDIPRLDNERLTPRFTAARSGSTARVIIDPGVACSVMAISIFDSNEFRNGKNPTVVAFGAEPFSMNALKKLPSPVLVAAIRCNDELLYRKAAWLFR